MTTLRRAIVTGPEDDSNPRWSLDGTRLAFLRLREGLDYLVTANADGSGQVVADTLPLFRVDPESIAWSHDGRSVAVMADHNGQRVIYVIDAIDHSYAQVPIVDVGPDMSWRPPDGHQLTFRAGPAEGFRLFLYSVDTGDVEELNTTGSAEGDIRPAGWTPDGLRYAFHEGTTGGRGITWIVDFESKGRTQLQLAYGQLSNDGTRVVGVNGDLNRTWLCVAPATGGDCLRIGPMFGGPWGSNHRWSPDDQWILSTREDDFMPFLFDPNTLTDGRPAWVDQGAESWQRLAP